MRAAAAQRDPHPVIESVELGPDEGGAAKVRIHTTRGNLAGRLHAAPGATAGAIMVGGVGGGFTGPASVYADLAEDLRRRGVSSLRLDFRNTTSLTGSVHDVLAGIDVLGRQGVERVVLIGWSFGGAVVIAAGALSERAAGVATVASQSHGTELVPQLAPRPLLLLHGTGDRTLTPLCSEDIFSRAGEPKELELYPGANHGLDQARERMRERLREWALRVLGKSGAQP